MTPLTSFVIVQRIGNNIKSPLQEAPYELVVSNGPPDSNAEADAVVSAGVVTAAALAGPLEVRRYGLVTHRQYKLRVRDARPESRAAWTGAQLRVSLAYQDTGELVQLAVPPGKSARYGKRRKHDVHPPNALAEDGPLLQYHAPDAAAGQSVAGAPTPCVEALLRVGPDGDTVGAFGFVATSFRHRRRVFCLRIALEGPRPLATVGRIELTTRTHAVKEGLPRSDPASDSASVASESDSSELESRRSDFPRQPKRSPPNGLSPPAAGASPDPSSLDTTPSDRNEDDALPPLDRLALEDNESDDEAVHTDLEEMGRTAFNVGKPSFALAIRALEGALGSLILAETGTPPTPSPDPSSPIPLPPVAVSPSSGPSPPAAAPAAPAAPPRVPHSDGAFRPEHLYPSPDAAEAAVALLAACAAGQGPPRLSPIERALAHPRLLASSLVSTLEGRYRLQRVLYGLCERGDRAVVDRFLETSRARLDSLPPAPTPETAELYASSIFNFVVAGTSCVGTAPLDIMLLSEGAATELLARGRAALVGHEEALPVVYCEWLYRRCVLEWQCGRVAAALELAYENWSELIRRQQCPSRAEARAISTLMALSLRVPGQLKQVKGLQGRAYWFEETPEDLLTKSLTLQCLGTVDAYRRSLSTAATYAAEYLSALEYLGAKDDAYKPRLARACFLHALGCLHAGSLATGRRFWKRVLPTFLEVCGPGDAMWDLAWLVRDHIDRIGVGDELHTPATIVRLMRLFVMLTRLSDPGTRTPLAPHVHTLFGEVHLRLGERRRAVESFQEALRLLQGRWPLLFTDSHPRVLRIRSLLEVARRGPAQAPPPPQPQPPPPPQQQQQPPPYSRSFVARMFGGPRVAPAPS